jgi:hypothetical protein
MVVHARFTADCNIFLERVGGHGHDGGTPPAPVTFFRANAE